MRWRRKPDYLIPMQSCSELMRRTVSTYENSLDNTLIFLMVILVEGHKVIKQPVNFAVKVFLVQFFFFCPLLPGFHNDSFLFAEVACLFLHTSWSHLAVNVYCLWYRTQAFQNVSQTTGKHLEKLYVFLVHCIYIPGYLRPWIPNGRYIISYWNQVLAVLC